MEHLNKALALVFVVLLFHSKFILFVDWNYLFNGSIQVFVIRSGSVRFAHSDSATTISKSTLSVPYKILQGTKLPCNLTIPAGFTSPDPIIIPTGTYVPPSVTGSVLLSSIFASMLKSPYTVQTPIRWAVTWPANLPFPTNLTLPARFNYPDGCLAGAS